MDFIVSFPKSQRENTAFWVIVDRLTKSTHFLPIKMTFRLDKLARLYIKEIIRLHKIPVSITSDRDTRFTSNFWISLQEAMGTQLKFSSTFHPQTDGQSERTIQVLEDMLRTVVADRGDNWVEILPLVKFAYNNSFQAIIGMVPYEALYGKKCRSPLYWDEVGERKLLGPNLAQEMVSIIETIR